MILLIFFTHQSYDLRALSDATFIPSALLIATAILIIIARAGTFDTAAYSFVTMGQRIRPQEPKRYKDAFDYKQKADEKRAQKGGYVLPFFVVGGLLLIISIITAFLSVS